MVSAILLDLGKVIVPFDFSIGYKALQAHCGADPAVIRERIRASGLVPRFETGLLAPEPFVDQLCSAIGVRINFTRFSEIWSSIFDRQTLLPDSFLMQLHCKYRLVLVSNTNALHFAMIRETYPLLRHFDATVLSYEVHAMKPAPAIFEAAIRAAQCPASECFFTDDIPEYVAGAQACGIQAVTFESFAQLQRELLARGVAWEP